MPTGLFELLIVGAIILLLFCKRLPGVMRSLGSSIVEFKKGVNERDEFADDDRSRLEANEKEQAKSPSA